MDSPATRTELPVELKAESVPLESALMLIGDGLHTLATCMPVVSDIEFSLTLDPVTRKAHVFFRATR